MNTTPDNANDSQPPRTPAVRSGDLLGIAIKNMQIK